MLWWRIPQLKVVGTEATPNRLSALLLTSHHQYYYEESIKTTASTSIDARLHGRITTWTTIEFLHPDLKAEQPMFPISFLVQMIHASWSLADLACTATLAKPPTPMAIRCDALWLRNHIGTRGSLPVLPAPPSHCDQRCDFSRL